LIIEIIKVMSESHDVLLAVRELYAAIERFDVVAARKLGIDRSALRAVNAMEHGGTSPGALVTQLGLSSGSITALLDRLERAGHIERRLSGDDGRKRDAHLTEAARGSVDSVYRQLGLAISDAFAELENAQRRELANGLVRLASAFTDAASSVGKARG
jgi:DNA-binding MarR family transcriptional regulator